MLSFLLCLTQHTFAAVTIDASSASSETTAASLTFSHTMSSGTNGLLIVAASVQTSGGATLNTVTFNGVSMTKYNEITIASTYFKLSLWYLIAPASGAHNVVATASTTVEIWAAAQSFTGVDQTTPLGTIVTNTLDSGQTTTSVNVSSATGDIVADTFYSSSVAGTPTVGSGQTAQGASGGAASRYIAMSTKAGASGTVTMAWTRTDSGDVNQQGVSVKAAVTSIPGQFPRIGMR